MATRFSSIIPGAQLSDQVAQALAVEIRAGRLAAGDKLPTEAALVEQFSVSRTVIREAVSRLKSLGLFETTPGPAIGKKDAGFSPLIFHAKFAVSKQAVIQMVEVRRARRRQRHTPTDLFHPAK